MILIMNCLAILCLLLYNNGNLGSCIAGISGGCGSRLREGSGWYMKRGNIISVILIVSMLVCSACGNGGAGSADGTEAGQSVNGTAGETEAKQGMTGTAGESGTGQGANGAGAAETFSFPDIGAEDFPMLDGSTATLPISYALYQLATGASRKEAEAAIQHNKTSQSYLNLADSAYDQEYRSADLVIAYEPGEEVRRLLQEQGDPLRIKPVGRDALVFMVNASNPVQSLTGEQIVSIYTGEMVNWSEAGGSDMKIEAFQRPAGSGSQSLMDKLVMKGTPMADAPPAYEIEEMSGLLEAVSSYDNSGNALGYSVYYYARNMYEKPNLRFMAVDGVMPDSETIRDGSYPYVSDFYAAVRKDAPEDSPEYRLFEWLTSDDGQALINGLGYVGISDAEKELPAILMEGEETPAGTIPLPENHVIVADGGYLTGEFGTAVYDGSLNLLHFYPKLMLSDGDKILECDVRNAVSLLDYTAEQDENAPHLSGLYSIEKDGWVFQPQPGFISTQKDGFYITVRLGSDSLGNTTDQFYYADRAGNVILEGDAAREKGEALSLYWSKEDYAKAYPDIVALYGDSDDVMQFLYGPLDIYGCAFHKDGVCHLYDLDGRHVVDIDENGYPAGEYVSYQILSVTDDVYEVCVVWYDENLLRSMRDFYICKDGEVLKKLSDEERKTILDVCESFYTAQVGNYICFYDYEDELCGRFLSGTDRQD